MVEQGMKCVKILLFAFNLLFFIFGLALVGVGIFVQIQLKQYFDFFSSPVNAPAILIIAVGAITLIVGFFGCCGAIKEHYCMTMTFAALIGIILVIEIAGGITGYVLRGKVDDIISKGMSSTLENYNSSDGVRATWDIVQKKLKCCGVENSKDWNGIVKVPKTCKPEYYNDGCLRRLQEFVTSNIIAVAGVAVGLAVVELIGIVLACCLARAIKKEDGYA